MKILFMPRTALVDGSGAFAPTSFSGPAAGELPSCIGSLVADDNSSPHSLPT